MSSLESPSFSALLFSLLIFLFTSQIQARFLQNDCPVSSCGEIETIDYPFRLKTDPPDCGHPSYELSCENNKTVLEFLSGRYYVRRISYEDHTLRVVDVNLANGSCSLPYSSVSVVDVNSDSHYTLVSGVYTSFVNCSSSISNPAYRRAPCLSGNGTNVYVSYDTYVISELQGSCSFLSRVPTIYQNVLFPSYENILKLMQSGFDLQWTFGCRNSYNCYYSDIYISPYISFIISAVWDILMIINLIARFILAPIVVIGFLLHKYRKTKKGSASLNKVVLNQQPLVPITRRYSYSDIIAITNNFRDKLGQGGFGIVYKGQLQDGCLVAVKMLGSSKFVEEDFIVEVSTIGRIHHNNVVKLLGFCSEGSHHALILEYMPNGSLDKYISAKQSEIQQFSWEKTLHIALGTAKGIEHLHGGCNVCILHCDIKPHNVLLDQNFTPKISDFGLAKFYSNDQDFLSHSTIRGTMGYIAPELLLGNLEAVSTKSDVYSYGMLLLEMAGGRRNADAPASGSSEVHFPSWVYERFSEGGDLGLDNVTATEAAIARKICIVGLWCIQKKASDRPTMTEVVKLLQGSVDGLRLPPYPMSFPEFVPKESKTNSSTELLLSETMEKSSLNESSAKK